MNTAPNRSERANPEHDDCGGGAGQAQNPKSHPTRPLHSICHHACPGVASYRVAPSSIPNRLPAAEQLQQVVRRADHGPFAAARLLAAPTKAVQPARVLDLAEHRLDGLRTLPVKGSAALRQEFPLHPIRRGQPLGNPTARTRRLTQRLAPLPILRRVHQQLRTVRRPACQIFLTRIARVRQSRPHLLRHIHRRQV